MFVNGLARAHPEARTTRAESLRLAVWVGVSFSASSGRRRICCAIPAPLAKSATRPQNSLDQRSTLFERPALEVWGSRGSKW